MDNLEGRDGQGLELESGSRLRLQESKVKAEVLSGVAFGRSDN